MEWRYSRILRVVTEIPWAILPAKLVIIRDLLAYRAAGHKLTAAEIREHLETAHNDQRETADSQTPDGRVAVIPLVGTIVPRADLFSEMSGAVSVQRFQHAFRAALENDEIDSIVIDVDSPGGQVGGIEELSTEIFQARGRKPIVAVANTLAASGAYWLATAADELIVSPTAEVGSIGVFTIHQDISKALEEEGVNISIIRAGKFKAEATPFEPLGEGARDAIQARVDDYYNMFVDAVARNRGVATADVRGSFGEGRVVGARDAIAMGMADRVGTLDSVISDLLGGNERRDNSSAGRGVNTGGITMSDSVSVPASVWERMWDRLTAAHDEPKAEAQQQHPAYPPEQTEERKPQIDAAEFEALKNQLAETEARYQTIARQQQYEQRVNQLASQLAKTTVAQDAELHERLAGLDDETAGYFVTQLKALSEQIRVSNLTADLGNPGPTEGGAVDLESLVTAKMAEKNISYHEAFKLVRAEHPGLVNERYGRNGGGGT